MGRKGQPCAVLVRNSCLVKFEDGFTAVTSHNGNALTAATFGLPVGEGLRWVVVHCQSLTSFGPVGSGPGDH